METPRFFRQDDEVVISTIVHNYLTKKKITKIHFEGKNLKLISSLVNSKEVINETVEEAKDTYEISIPSQTN